MKTFTTTLTTYFCYGRQIDLTVSRQICGYSQQFQDTRIGTRLFVSHKTDYMFSDSSQHSVKAGRQY